MQIPKPSPAARGFIIYLGLSIALAAGFGYSACSVQSQQNLLTLADQNARERSSIIRRHTAEKKYLREQLAERNKTIARQSDQLAGLSKTTAEGAKAAINLMEQSK